MYRVGAYKEEQRKRVFRACPTLAGYSFGGRVCITTDDGGSVQYVKPLLETGLQLVHGWGRHELLVPQSNGTLLLDAAESFSDGEADEVIEGCAFFLRELCCLFSKRERQTE